MLHGWLAILVLGWAAAGAVEPGAAVEAGSVSEVSEEPGSANWATEDEPSSESRHGVPTYPDGRALLVALGRRDGEIQTLTGDVRLTAIQTLQGDTQRRFGRMAMRTVKAEAEEPGSPPPSRATRMFAVSFDRLQLDRRVEEIQEEYIFDGRWLVERLPAEKQFIKREIVPAGRVLDPMELMRDAPFWVSVGDDADRVLRDYDAVVLPTEDGLTVNAESEELAALVRLVGPRECVQLKLTPREGSAAEDDWQSVRMWFTPDTLLPVLYIKTAWTGDLQIAELFGVKINGEVSAAQFDTTAPEPGSGWQVQISAWRGAGGRE